MTDPLPPDALQTAHRIIRFWAAQGGKKSRRNMTPQQRSHAAAHAARVRWDKYRQAKNADAPRTNTDTSP